MVDINDEFAHAFGNVVHQSANFETGLKITLAGILDIRPRQVLILVEPYSAPKLRGVLKSIARQSAWPEGALEELVGLIGQGKAHIPLRNHIAHSRWTEGVRQNSIKPIGLKINNENVAYFGNDDEERDWLAEEIAIAGNELRMVCERLTAFNDKFGLTDKIAAHLDANEQP
ncbi:hypothetical protein HFP57_01215 [Parasphingopyxis algicola]|uniref:hypothetical protein n=1 Tax=Parasphingopyxis algicola TaxID=2026624 RepID=UPI0015A2CDE2|nr:hypothetical protein [Parasphingopyxis algicola]QLC23786.1 hypothetical protein HFP57_01215 [Parasphingopyxis algicola]